MISFRGLETSTILDGDRILIIGPTGCGKTTLIKHLLDLKRENVKEGLIFNESVSEEEYRYYPTALIYDKYSSEIVNQFVKEQKLFKNNRYLVLDDINPEVLENEEILSIFKNNKHYSMYEQNDDIKNSLSFNIFYLQSFQYPVNLKPIYRCHTDMVFLFKPRDENARRIMWENYASMIPVFEIFCSLMDELHSYEALVINKKVQSSNWKDFISWYKAV